MQQASAAMCVTLDPFATPREVRERTHRLRGYLCGELRETLGDVLVRQVQTTLTRHDTHQTLAVTVTAERLAKAPAKINPLVN
jgi:hypothetical protein